MNPSERYPSLPIVHKLEIIAFLCELVVQTKQLKDAMEESMSDLTEVRKDLLDVRRDRKKLYASTTIHRNMLITQPKVRRLMSLLSVSLVCVITVPRSGSLWTAL